MSNMVSSITDRRRSLTVLLKLTNPHDHPYVAPPDPLSRSIHMAKFKTLTLYTNTGIGRHLRYTDAAYGHGYGGLDYPLP